ncbi:MAG: hypothetical protein ABI068_01345 [Ktedonobacterales bacterium]
MANNTDTPAGDQSAHTMLLRIRRGAVALGTDGELGSVQQIVVDRESNELRALVVRLVGADSGETRELEIPVSHIQHASGSQVQLDFGRADLRAHPELAPLYNPDDYTPVDQGARAQEDQAQRVAAATEHPVVTQVERDAAAVVMPETLTDDAPTASQQAMDVDSQRTAPAMKATRRPSSTAGSGRVDTPMTLATPVADTPPPVTGQAMGATSAPLTGPSISASKSALPDYGVDSTLPQRPGADAIGVSATTPANDIPPMAIPTPDAAEPMGATLNLSATDPMATDFTPARSAQLDELQPVMLGGLSTPIPPTRQLPEPGSRFSFKFSPVVVLLLGGVGLLVAAVWVTSRVKRAEHAVERQVGSKRARARLKGQMQRSAQQAQRQAQHVTQQTAQQAMKGGQQAARQALVTAATWRDALAQQAQTTGASLADTSQSLANKAWNNAMQVTAQAQATLPGKLANLRNSTGTALGATRKTARMAVSMTPERARRFRRGFQVRARLDAVGGATAARMSAWGNAFRAGWFRGAATTDARATVPAPSPAPLVVQTTDRPRWIVLFRRRTDVPTDVTP